MKKLALLTALTVGASMAAFSQGVVFFNDESTPGYVIEDPAGHMSSSTASYTPSANFTAQLWALSGNVTSLSGLGVDSYGYIDPLSFSSLGFNLVGTTLGGSDNGVTFGGGNGYFDGGKQTITGTSGGYNVTTSTYTAQNVLAVVCWTGNTENTLAQAIAANDLVGIFAFVNNIGPGGTSPAIPNLTGWPTTLSPANSANDGYPELIMASVVPEPTTFAMLGLGGLSLLLFRRRK